MRGGLGFRCAAEARTRLGRGLEPPPRKPNRRRPARLAPRDGRCKFNFEEPANLVSDFGGWGRRRGDACGQNCRVEGYYGDDNVGDHYWFGVDEDAVG